MSGSDRIDRLLVERAMFATRAQARAAIEAGGVRVNGELVRKPSQSVPTDAAIEAEPAHPWVSRGGVKLAAALDAFEVDPAGRACLDVGASTGGFTHVLLARGAGHVTAVDVGRGQLRALLREDARVRVLEATDARALTPSDFETAPSLVVSDVSFISLDKALPAALGAAAPQAELVALFKPQFEVGRAHVGKGGLVSDADAVCAALERTRAWLSGAGWPVAGVIDSPIRGGDGNRELLLHARRSA